MKRSWSWLLAALALVVVGCGGGAPASSGNQPVTIRWGIYADPSRLQVAQQQVDQFHKLHPNITVKIQAVPFADYYSKLGTQLAAGTGNDVMMMSGAYFSKIAPQGGLMDLTSRIKSDNIDLSQYTTEKANSQYNGKTLALPYELDIQGLYYNKDLFDAAHQPYPTAGWTWGNLRTAAKNLTRTVDGHQTWGYYSDDLYPTWVSYVGQAGGSIFSKDGKTPTIDTPQVKSALTFLTDDLIYQDHSSPAPGQLPQGTNPFQSGLVAMVVDGSYSVLPTLQTVKFNWDVAPLPHEKKAAAAYWTQGIAVYSKTKHADQAWEFAKFLASAQGQEVLATTKFATPSLKKTASSSAYLNGKPAHTSVFIDSYKNAVPVPFNDKWFEIMSGPNSAMGDPFSQLWLHKISVDQAVSKAQASTQRVLQGG